MTSGVKNTFHYLWVAIKLILLIVGLFVLSLFFREQRLPRFLVDWFCHRFSNAEVVWTCDSAYIGFQRGLIVKGLKLYEHRSRRGISPLASVDLLTFNHLRRDVRLKGLKFSRLPALEEQPLVQVAPPPQWLSSTWVDLPEMTVVCEQPNILGVEASRVDCRVKVHPNGFNVEPLRIKWPERDESLSVYGFCQLNLKDRCLTGEVRGFARQPYIRPLFEALSLTCPLTYFDAFTGIREAIPVDCDWCVDLGTSDFSIQTKISPTLGYYREIPLAAVEGTIGFRYGAPTEETNRNFGVSIDLARAVDEHGRALKGRLDLTHYEARPLRFDLDAESNLELDDILRIAQLENYGSFTNYFVCETSPIITSKGSFEIGPGATGTNHLAGSVSVWRAVLKDLHLENVGLNYVWQGDHVWVTNLLATGKSGGLIQGSVEIARAASESASSDSWRLACRGTYDEGSFEEVSELLSFEQGKLRGRIHAAFDLALPIQTQALAQLNGRAQVRVQEGHLLQMKLFAGLTQLLADKVPGVGYLVNQSEGSVDLVATNGVISTENLFIEGGLISIKGWGTYDCVKDQLDLTVRVQLLKEASFMGKLLHPLTWPFTKLLLEFKALGSIKEPQWRYISVIDRVL